jgi:rhodanese-related sulfurtransferase
MDIAVPANLRCGQPDGGAALPQEPDWAPLTYTFNGLWEIQPAVLEECTAGGRAASIQIIDVREAAEFTDTLGHISGARLLPLADLSKRLDEIDRTRPVVAVCRSGARSAQAVVLLNKAGFAQVANLAGGMLRWWAQALPVESGKG